MVLDETVNDLSHLAKITSCYSLLVCGNNNRIIIIILLLTSKWFITHTHMCTYNYVYTAISRNVVGKSTRNNRERYCGWFCGHCSSKKFERMVQEATDICLRVLKESNKSRFDSFSPFEQCIDHIPYYLSGLSRAHFI